MNIDTMRLLVAKGLTADDLLEVAEAMGTNTRNANAERQARFRERRKAAKEGRDVTDNVTRNATGSVTPPNEYISNPPVPPSSANADDAPPPVETRFVEAWNGEGGLRPARKLAGQRLTKFRKRLREFGEETLFEAVRKLGASAFHCGKNDREWQADIGWFIKSDDNVTKALELPDPKQGASGPVDALKTAENAAALYRRMGRDEDAAQAEQRAARLRERATGPPRPIGQILRVASSA
jgi:hypothetical protein